MSRIDYVDLEALKTTLKLEATNFADEDIELGITAAGRAIDDAMDRYFGKSEDDAQRIYTPTRRLTLDIDDLIELGALEIDTHGDGDFETTWTLGTDFVLEPANAAADGRPWERVKVRKRSGKLFPLTEQCVRVTGRFGWEEVPPGVVQYTGILAIKLLRRATEAPTPANFGPVVAALETGTALEMLRTDPEAEVLLDGLSRETFLV